MRILLAEEDLTSRAMLSAFLWKNGYEVIEAANGEKVLAAMQQEDAPRLAIIDSVMPDMDGLEIIRRIRSRQTRRPPYLIMMTSMGAKTDTVAGLEAGVNDYFLKPLDPGELLARIKLGRRVITMQGELIESKSMLAAKADALNLALDQIKALRGSSEGGRSLRGSAPDSVVVVNDDQAQLNLLCTFLKKAGFEPRGYTGAEEALGAMSAYHPPALIITDLYMPGLDGWRFCRLLRSAEYPAYNQVPVLVVSATFAGEEPKSIAASLGVDAFLASPLDRDVFIQQVQLILDRQRTHQPLSALIIDDSKTITALLSKAFTADGYKADTAMTAREAADAFFKTDYDVAIIDYYLPDGHGDTLLERFRSQRPECVCIMMTTDPRPELALEWMNRGAAAYVRKPFEPAYLLKLCDQTRRERSLLRVEDLLEARTRELIECRDRIRALTESAQDAIVMMDPRGAISFWNPAAESIFGYSQQEALGRTLHELIVPPKYQAAYTAALARFEQTGTCSAMGQTIALQAQCKNGREIPIELSLSAQQLSDGWHASGIIRDITERARADDALRSGEKIVSSILNSIDDAVMSYSIREDRFLYLSPATETIFGRSIEECRGNRHILSESVHPDDAAILHAITMQLSESGAAQGEYRIIRPDGSVAWIRARAKLIYNENGEPDRIDRTVSDITERKAIERQLRAGEEQIHSIMDAIDDVVMTASLKDNSVRYLSASFKSLFGSNVEPHLSNRHLWAESVHPDDHNILHDHIMQLSEQGSSDREFRIIKPDGEVAWVRSRSKIIVDENGTPDRIQRILTDITGRKQAEQERENLQKQLLQAQKMESAGRLAGGIAHDFNNMLSVIIGHAELALYSLSPGHHLYNSFNQIRKAAERSAALTRQLLAFARKQTIVPKILDLNETVESMITMLRQSVGENIALVWHPGQNLAPVRIDPSQIDQVLANLCINARDAIADNGTITIETGTATISATRCEHNGREPGEYVTLAVSDSGHGMDKATLANIFEPFFTTKEVGKGSGLGLPTVYGIVEQNGGFIDVESEPGHGTRFVIHLPPCTVGDELQTRETSLPPPATHGTETILLAEDEPDNLDTFRTMLESLGYNVLAASTPRECIRLAESHPGSIDLLVTDVVMPEINGRELADTITAANPATKCLFMSGYSANVISRHGVLDPGVNFIEKPFTLQIFADKIRSVLSCANKQ